MDIKQTIMERYDASERAQSQKFERYGVWEDLFHNRLGDQISAKTKSQVFDPILATLTMDRAARVMAQLATGKVKAVSKNDEGASQLMNLTLDKYIIPNANAQFDFLTKLRMIDLYSNIYGVMYAMVDWDVKPNGYIGPDMWLLPIRDVFRQVGAVSVRDSDHIIVKSWRTLSYFESLASNNKNNEDFKNLPKIIDILKEKAGDKEGRDASKISNREQQEYATAQAAKGTGYYEILSMYEGDRWVDFVPSADMEFRDIENPHENGELPVVEKFSVPLLDDPAGMGDFERGTTMQLTRNSLWNMYLDGVKMSIFPPIAIDNKAIADRNSIKWSSAAKWLFNGPPGPSISPIPVNPQGTNTFNNVQNLTNSALLSMMGTTDTSVTENQDPGFGKTPQALKMQASRENARDNVDRYYMEQFVTQVSKKFVNLMSKKGDKVQIRMFEEEIEEMAKKYPEIGEMYDPKTGKLNIDSKRTGSVLYDYEIISGSTFAVDQQKQTENLIGLFEKLTTQMAADPQSGEITSPLIAYLKKKGKEVHLDEILTRLMVNSGVQDWDKIITDTADDPEAILDDTESQFAKLMQQFGGLTDEQGQPMAQPMDQAQMQGAPKPGQPMAPMEPTLEQKIGGQSV